MMNEKKDRDSQKTNEEASPRPDQETLHRTDPQEHMKGPVSSLMQNTGEGFDTDETKDEADQKIDENL